MLRERELYASSLRAAGYYVVNADSFTAACRMATASSLDVVVTDVRIGGSIGGLELIRRLRHDSRTTDVRIIVMTSVSRPQDQEVALKAGANRVLQKPVAAPMLAEEIGRLLHLPCRPSERRERDPRVCPLCVGLVRYRDRWPILSVGGHVAAHPGPRERLRYASGWFCTNPACEYVELTGRTESRE